MKESLHFRMGCGSKKKNGFNKQLLVHLKNNARPRQKHL